MLTEERARLFIEKTLAGDAEHARGIRRRVDELGLDHEELRVSQMAFVKTLCLAVRPKNILELGTFLGYSALGFAEVLAPFVPGGLLTTVDCNREHADMARTVIESAGLADHVNFELGRDDEICRRYLAEQRRFDMVFLDTAERNYADLYPLCIDLLHPGGVFIADNALMLTADGWATGKNIVESREGPELQALARLFDLAAGDERVLTSLVPIGVGILFCVKKPRAADAVKP